MNPLVLTFLFPLVIATVDVCTEEFKCSLEFAMVTPVTACHCSLNGYLVVNPRTSSVPMGMGCLVSVDPVMASDAGVWECQSPQPLQKSEQRTLQVLGWLGNPRISESNVIVNQNCHHFQCECEVQQAPTYILWLDAQTNKSVPFLALTDSLTRRIRKSTITICLDGDMDLVCQIRGVSGDYRTSYPLRFVQI